MRYRRLDASGDMTFGQSQANFLTNTPEGVGQAVMTRLLLARGEWFLDDTEGTPYRTEILGVNKRPTYDRAIRRRILGSQGVKSILSYSSSLDGRALSVSAEIDTIYGQTTVTGVL